MYMLTKCINNEWHLKQTKKFTKKADVLLFSSHGRFDESFPASALLNSNSNKLCGDQLANTVPLFRPGSVHSGVAR